MAVNEFFKIQMQSKSPPRLNNAIVDGSGTVWALLLELPPWPPAAPLAK
jgi:hypothetical protein